MASQNTAFLALFRFLNLGSFLLLVDVPLALSQSHPKPKACHPLPSPSTPTPRSPTVPTSSTPTPTPSTPSTPTPSTGTRKCPINTLKLGACANLLDGLLGTIIGTPPSKQCCGLIQGLADAEDALCLCIAIKAHVLGININVPVAISLILSACQKELPKGFQCS